MKVNHLPRPVRVRDTKTEDISQRKRETTTHSKHWAGCAVTTASNMQLWSKRIL